MPNFDGTTGESVLLAEVKASEGQLVGEDIVIYPDAFTDVLADVKYHYSLSSFEQDVVVRSQLPGPEKFGMNPKSVRLQVLTEFVESPSPAKENRQAGGLADQALRFGQMSIGSGKAFSVDAVGDATGQVPVAKEWAPLDGRGFLIEEVYYEEVAEQLQKLPTDGEYKGASLPRRGTGANVIAGLKMHLPTRYAKAAPKPEAKRMAQVPPKAAPGFVMDYVLLTSQANFTFQGDSTYYVSGLVNLSASGVGGATTIEAGTIVKFTNSATAKINLTGPGNFQTSQSRPAVFTSKDDNTVGETIPGSTGNPTNYNGGTYLSTQEHYTYKHLRMAYAGIAIRPDDNDSEIWHCQFVRCGTAISVSTGGNVSLHNTLFSGCGTAIASGDGARGEHVTADQIGTFLAYGAGYLTNSLLTAVTNLGVTRYNCVTNASGNGIYQTVGAASYYLVASSTNRNAGTTNLNATLADDLRTRTTYPPLAITTNFTAATVLAPQAQRDTDQPDLGYHYAPLDYVVNGRTVSANLTLTNGVALGTYGSSSSYGLALNSGSFLSEGTPTRLNWIARYNTVQEQSTTNWSASTVGPNVKRTSSSADVNIRFTGWSLLGGIGDHFNDTTDGTTPTAFTHSQFGGGKFTIDPGAVALTNCLWERVYLKLVDNADAGRQWYLFNNLFAGGTLYYRARGDNAVLRAYDNLFAQTTVTKGTSSEYFTHDYNGYVTNQSRLAVNGAHDVILTNRPAYHAGRLGRYYYPTNDGMLSLLIDAGSRPADDAGLYHFTMHTNQVKETNSLVDIGYHCAALDTNGIPTDTDGDGISDYLDPESTPRTDIFWSHGLWHWKPDSLAWNCWTNALACTNLAQGNFPHMFTDFSPTDKRNHSHPGEG